MARDSRVCTVLVAYPSDVQGEVEAVRRAVEELNRTLGPALTARLEVVDWQTHVSPGAGLDTQGVISRQLPTDYDIFLGVMWTRFGTETPRAGSGTEEEFEAALARHRSSGGDLRIMFYFKEAPLSPNAIDSAQLEKVKAFRQRLEDGGVLYRAFGTEEEFERVVREDLTREFMALAVPTAVSDGSSGEEASNVELEGEEDSEELGYIDYLDEAEDLFAGSNAVTERLTVAIKGIGSKMHERGEEMNAAAAEPGPLTRQKSRALIGHAADDMNAFAVEVGQDLPKLRTKLLGAITAVREATRLVPEGSAKAVTLKKSLADLDSLDGSFGSAIDGTKGFLQSVSDLPRMTKELSRAKKRVVGVLEEVISTITSGRILTKEAVSIIEAALREMESE